MSKKGSSLLRGAEVLCPLSSGCRKRGLALRTVLAVLTDLAFLESTFHWSYKLQHKEATVLALPMRWGEKMVGDGPNTVSGSTVSNAELSEFLLPSPSSRGRAQ